MSFRLAPGAVLARSTLVLVLLGLGAPAAADVTINFVPPDSVAVPDSFTVQLTVDTQATDLRGFSVALSFDPDFLQALAVRPGSLFAASGCDPFLYWLNEADVMAGDSTLVFDGAGLGCSLVGPGAIVELDFACLDFGPSLLACQSVVLRDSLNEPVASTCIEATITCESPIAVRPTSWGCVKARYRRE